MAKDIAFLPIHGMGKTRADFAEDLEEELQNELEEGGWNRIHFEPIFFKDYYRRSRKQFLRP